MDAITAYRAIINLIDGNDKAFKAILSDYKSEVDAESGLPHLWHAACNIAFLLELDIKK